VYNGVKLDIFCAGKALNIPSPLGEKARMRGKEWNKKYWDFQPSPQPSPNLRRGG
jgi:hypothetical protein